MSTTSISRGGLALVPLFLFLSLFLGTGFYLQSQGVEYAFYQLPAPVAILPAILVAVWLSKASLNRTIETFIQGAGHKDIITMCMIFLLAGAFSAIAKQTGGVDATVALGLNLIPSQFLLPGLFLLGAFVSTCMGTSMGTLAAMAPIGLAISQATGIDPALMAGVLMSGAIFGDNLSIISDTTIAATRTQGCQMRDKFIENIKMSLPAALMTLLLLALFSPEPQPIEATEGNPWMALPYLAVLILAVTGVNVFVVLLVGILASMLMGVWQADYQLANFAQDIYAGFTSLQEIFLLSMLIGGLSMLIREQGGLAFLVDKIHALAARLSNQAKASHSFAIAALAAVSNLCIANNSVAIIVSGEAARKLAEQGGISAKRSASLIDIFTCVVQGLIPYGAQALLLGASLSISPISIFPYVFYCYLLALVACSYIIWKLIKAKR